MTRLITISAIMTVKNGASFIERSISSILQQTYKPIELIIVDDGSNDLTGNIIKRIQAKNEQFPIKLITTEGVGRANALNLAIENSEGNWIANLDVDDYWQPQKLEYQVEIIKKIPSVQVVITGVTIIQEHQKSLIQEKIFDSYSYRRIKKKEFYSRNPIDHSSIIYTRKIFLASGKYNKNLNKQIDYDLWIRFILKNADFYKINQSLSIKYLHKNQNFEAKNKYIYRINALLVNLKSLKKLNAEWHFYIISFIYFFGGLLPRKIKNLMISR